MLRRLTVLFGVLGAGTFTSNPASATGAAPCLAEGYRPAFACVSCGITPREPFVVGRTVHLYGHDFDRYQNPLVMGRDSIGQPVVWAPAMVVSAEEAVFDAPLDMTSGQVWLEDAQPIHDVGPWCMDPASGQSWEGPVSGGCHPAAEMCRGEVQSVLRTIDERYVRLPVPAATQLRVVQKFSNAVTLDWNVDPRSAVDIRVEWRGPGMGWSELGFVGRAYGPELITMLQPGASYEFRVQAVARSGERSTRSDSVQVDLPQIEVEYLDSQNAPHPFAGTNSGAVLMPDVTGVWVIHDHNSDSIVPYALGTSPNTRDPNAIFPRYFDGTRCLPRSGARYAPGANTILLVEWSSGPGRAPEFAVVHLALAPQAWSGIMAAGSGSISGVIMGTPSRSAFDGELLYQTPTYDNPLGFMEGWVSSALFHTSCNGTTYGSTVRIRFPSGLVISPESALP